MVCVHFLGLLGGLVLELSSELFYGLSWLDCEGVFA